MDCLLFTLIELEKAVLSINKQVLGLNGFREYVFKLVFYHRPDLLLSAINA